jgi:hypothetical protein
MKTKTMLAGALVALSSVILFVSASSAFGQGFTIQVLPSEATLSGSSLASVYTDNADGALFNGVSSQSTGFAPAYYAVASGTLAISDNIGTPHFVSHAGTALSSTDPTWRGYNGTGLNWGFVISSSTAFTLSELSFASTETGGDTSLETSVSAGAFQYSRNLVGWTGSSWIFSGANTQPVYELIGLGPTTSFVYGGASDTLANEQQGINAYINGLEGSATGPFGVTGTYSIGGQSGSALVTYAVPEPCVSALLGCGVVAVILTKRTRKRVVVISKRLQ